jgi:hypothetical protein
MKLNYFLALLLTVTIAVSCNNKKETKQAGFELTGTIEGLAGGKVYLMNKSTGWKDSLMAENDKISYKGNFAEPTMLALQGEMGYITQFFAENTKVTITGKFGDMSSYKVVGGKANEEKNACAALIQKMYKEQNYSRAMMMELYNPKTTDARRKEVEAKKKIADTKREEIQLDFIKNNPASYYSAYLVMIKAHGAPKDDLKALLALLDPSLKDYPMIKELSGKLAKMEKTEATLEEFVKDASNIAYKVDSQYKGSDHKGIVYLGMFSDNNLCALKADGNVMTVSVKGEKLAEFKAEAKGQLTSIAIDKADNVYVMDVQQEMVERKVRGRVHSYPNPVGVECTVYTKAGEKKSTFKCENIVTASGARVVGGKLLLSDNRGGLIGIYDVKTGKMVSKISDMRPCCGILDFSVNKKNQLLVANLGAFRVQSFDLSGKCLMEYGKRGKGLENFHGCCNPVSVASLNNGALVTVEKDPTRIKVYSKDGAKQIQGIQELVHGCSYIPMIVDANDNLYLASAEEGIVKCVAM